MYFCALSIPIIVVTISSCCEAQINFGGRGRGSSAGVEARAFSSSRGRASASASVTGAVSSHSGGQTNSLTFHTSHQSGGRASSRIRVQEASSCVAAAACSSELFSFREFSSARCSLPGGSPGFRCAHTQSGRSSRRPFRSADTAGAGAGGARASSSGDISLALRSSRSRVSNITRLSVRRYAAPLPGSASFFHARFQRQARAEVQQVARHGLLTSQAALDLARISPRRGTSGGPAPANDAINFGSSAETSLNLEAAGLTCSGSSLTCGFDVFR